MFERKSLRLPITLGVVMIVLLVVLIIGWVILTVSGAISDDQRAGLYWAMLSIGATLLGFVLVGVVMYLTLSIKAINLGQRQSNFIDSVTHELKSPYTSTNPLGSKMKSCIFRFSTATSLIFSFQPGFKTPR